MTIPETGFPLAAAISPRVQVVPTTDSTNADLSAAVAADAAAWPHLSVLVTDDQRHGRGRLDRTWTAPPGTALAVSVVARVPGIPITRRGWVPLIAGAAMAQAVRAQFENTGHTIVVKWPNDVLVDGGKICGILAETVPGDPGTVVIGVGVNTRMRQEDLPVANATSFAGFGREADVDRLLSDLLRTLDERLTLLAAHSGDADAAGVRAWVQELCGTLGAEVAVSLPDGSTLRGTAERLDDEGRLVVVADGVETAVSAGDVTHVR